MGGSRSLGGGLLLGDPCRFRRGGLFRSNALRLGSGGGAGDCGLLLGDARGLRDPEQLFAGVLEVDLQLAAVQSANRLFGLEEFA